MEIGPDQIVEDNLSIMPGQEFRLKDDFYGKYIWMTSDRYNKIYKQIRGVSYADYKPGCYYISPYEAK